MTTSQEPNPSMGKCSECGVDVTMLQMPRVGAPLPDGWNTGRGRPMECSPCGHVVLVDPSGSR